MSLAIVGSRSFVNYDSFCQKMKEYVNTHGMPKEVISGGAQGADTLAQRWAHEHNVPLRVFRPDYKKYAGHVAPLQRNTLIIEAATAVVAFPTSESRGTWDTVRKAQQKGISCIVYETS